MQIGLLGTIDVREVGDAPELTGQRRKALLALLALHPGQPVAMDRIIDAVWTDKPPATALNTVQSHVSHLRRVLGSREAILARSGGYSLAVEAEQIDAHRAEQLIEEAGRAGPATAAELLGRALGLWRGRPLADLDELPAFGAPAQRLAELRMYAVEQLMAVRLGLGEGPALVRELEQLAAEHPLREGLHGQLMLALYRAGRQADALKAYQSARTVLVEELGVDPGAALRELEAAILRQDDALLRPSAAAAATTTEQPVPAAAPLHRPPLPLSGLVGRGVELEQLDRLLAAGPVVTITGTGGAGKTRLSLEAARLAGGRFADGAAFADLSAVQPGGVERQVADALAVSEEPDHALRETLAAALAGREVLLLLDNCEHVLDAVAPLVEDLAAAAPGLRVLATSREPLAVQGEACLPLAPLPVPAATSEGDTSQGDVPSRPGRPADALVLLVERAVAADPSFRLTSENSAVLGRLCRALDGLPLALELAAARLRTMTPEELLAGLDGRLDGLGPGRRTAAPRHRSLRAALEWSHDLLDEAEQTVFRRMAVFHGGAGLDLAQQVCDPEQPGRARGVLASLVDKSLLVRTSVGGSSRLAMHETTRRYAAGLLADGPDAAGTARRHAEAFRALAGRAGADLHGPREQAALDRLGADDANLRAATAWAVTERPALATELAGELWWYWFRTSRCAEGLAATRAALEAAERAGLPAAAEAWAGAGYLAWVVDDYDAAARYAARALADPAAGQRIHALAHGVLARATGDSRDFASAAEHALRSVELYEAAGDVWGAAWSRRCYASGLLYGGDVAGSVPVCRASRASFEQLGDEWGAAGAVDVLAVSYAQLGDYRRALELAEESVARHQALGDSSGTRYALQHLAEAALAAGDRGRARAAAVRSLAMAQQHGYRTGAQRARELLAQIAEQDGRAPAPTPAATTGAEPARPLDVTAPGHETLVLQG